MVSQQPPSHPSTYVQYQRQLPTPNQHSNPLTYLLPPSRDKLPLRVSYLMYESQQSEVEVSAAAAEEATAWATSWRGR